MKMTTAKFYEVRGTMNTIRIRLRQLQEVKPSFVSFSTIMLMLASLVIGPLAYAQNSAGSIKGIVKDQLGFAKEDATITAKRLETNTVTVVKTDATGSYAFTSLPVGRYELSIVAKGKHTSFSAILIFTADRFFLSMHG